MITLSRVWRDFHFPEQRVHFRDGQNAARTHRSVASHRCSDVIEPFFQTQCFAESRQFVGKVGDKAAHVALAQKCGHAADQHCCGAEAFQVKAEFSQLREARFEAVASRLLKFDNFGE